MVRSKIGPFAIEGPLGGSKNDVFRAIHLQQKLQVALRVFSVPLGMTPQVKREFATEMERLKLLRDTHVSRCFGGGFDQRDVYIATELVEGDSLEEILRHRERLAWETVLDYGLQLCQALSAIHTLGIVHGRLTPTKLLTTLAESVIKIGDVRTDKSLQNGLVQSLDPAKIVYSAPERFDESVPIRPSADLYSMGAILYHALTGKPPFEAGNAHFMKQSIRESVPPAVSSIVFDCPVWLSTVVQHLLEKNPDRRPFSAEAAAMAFRTAQQHAMQGISVAEHLVSGFSPLQMQADKEEAAKVLGLQPKKTRRKKQTKSVGDSTWFILGGIAASLGGIYFMTLPMSEEAMYSKASALMAEDDSTSHDYAEENYLLPMLQRYPEGKRSAWVKDQLETIEMETAERLMDRNRRFNRDPSSEGERKFEEAQRFERFGDRVTAIERYKAIVDLLGDVVAERAFVNLSNRQIAKLAEASKESDEDEVKVFLTEKLDEADRLFTEGDVVTPKKTWESILKLYNGNKEMLPLVQRAQRSLDRLMAPETESRSDR